MRNNGYTAIEALVVILIIAVISVVGYWIYSKDHRLPANTTNNQSSVIKTSNSAANPYATLSPASVPSKTLECSQAVSYASNGVPGPVQCANGYLNKNDWQALAALEPSVLSLGYNATSTQVEAGLCSDVKANISNPIEETVYQIASLYYGWNFNPNPATILSSGSCQNVDD